MRTQTQRAFVNPMMMVVFSLCALPALPALPVPQEPSFRTASSELVVLPVVVSDKPDQYVADLRQDQFTVYDNGRRMAVDFFSSDDTPVTIGLVVDSSGSMRRNAATVSGAASPSKRAVNEKPPAVISSTGRP